MEITYTTNSIPETLTCLLAAFPAARVWALQGDLGAGKTTLVRALARHLGATQPATSPTFTLANEYALPGGGRMYHLDLYRLRREEELDGIGLDEYTDADHWCCVEWPELAARRLPPGTLWLWLQAPAHNPDERTLHARTGTPWPGPDGAVLPG